MIHTQGETIMTKQMQLKKDIESTAFRFGADVNGETHFTVEEARWLRDTLDCLLYPSGITESSPISFTLSVEAFHNRAITSGEFHENADRLLMAYASASLHPTEDGPRMM